MPDARPGHGTPIDLARLRTLMVGSRTRTTVREGREHPETGVPWKATTTEAGTTIEHATRDDRVDVRVRPETLRVTTTTLKELADGRA
jgi:hypothetical protein